MHRENQFYAGAIRMQASLCHLEDRLQKPCCRVLSLLCSARICRVIHKVFSYQYLRRMLRLARIALTASAGGGIDVWNMKHVLNPRCRAMLQCGFETVMAKRLAHTKSRIVVFETYEGTQKPIRVNTYLQNIPNISAKMIRSRNYLRQLKHS